MHWRCLVDLVALSGAGKKSLSPHGMPDHAILGQVKLSPLDFVNIKTKMLVQFDVGAIMGFQRNQKAVLFGIIDDTVHKLISDTVAPHRRPNGKIDDVQAVVLMQFMGP